MIDNPFQRNARDEEIERRLATYAAARLDPSPEAVERMRAAVLLTAREHRAAFSRGNGLWRSRRLAAAALLAAALAVVVGGAALGAAPGSPLYGVRLWVEQASLPSDANARADAQLALLQERVAEAQDAAAKGNGRAVSAALAAYRAEVADLLATVGDDDARLAKLAAALGTHLVVLQTLETRVPDQARDAIQNAIDNSSKAVDKVLERQGHPGKPSPGAGETPKPDRSPHPGPSDHPSGGTGGSEAP